MKHVLLTLDANLVHCHGYLVCDGGREREREYLESAMDRMVLATKDEGLTIRPTALITDLTTKASIDLVREIIGKHFDDAAKKATGFMAWISSKGLDDDDRIMTLHTRLWPSTKLGILQGHGDRTH